MAKKPKPSDALAEKMERLAEKVAETALAEDNQDKRLEALRVLTAFQIGKAKAKPRGGNEEPEDGVIDFRKVRQKLQGRS